MAKTTFVLYLVVKCPHCNRALEDNGALALAQRRLTHQPSGCKLDGKVFLPPTVTLDEVVKIKEVRRG